jgi:hypothetical protein
MKGCNLILESCMLTLELCLYTQPGISLNIIKYDVRSMTWMFVVHLPNLIIIMSSNI